MLSFRRRRRTAPIVSTRLRALLLAGALAAAQAAAAAAGDLPFERTEERQDCADFNPLKNPYFGDLHVHTSFSFDAALRATINDPRDAYRFAQGDPLPLPDADGNQTRTIRIDRPLDFVAVTDHSEYFGEIKICTTPGLPGFNSVECQLFRLAGDALPAGLVNTIWTASYLGAPNGVFMEPVRFPFCFLGDPTLQDPVNCLSNSLDFWQEIQAAAEEAYDRTSACTFTSFVAYEWTGTPRGNNLHRNVIFRNERVPALPISYMETSKNPRLLWQGLTEECLEAGTGCDVLAIPHNPNYSGGLQFQMLASDPVGRLAEATARQRLEPLVEMIQHKGASECRTGVGTSDEACGFEQIDALNFAEEAPGADDFPANSFVRNFLKDGLLEERELGVNPFKSGFVAGTDTHNGTPGATDEASFQGHDGDEDSDAVSILEPKFIERGPGGLAVAWAEENSRDALFTALRRRETYATSGTRPIVRFFGGWQLPPGLCANPEFVELGYQLGVAMGSDLKPRPGDAAIGPRFAVMAFQDAGTTARPGTPLQRVQIVKGWLDAAGETHEQVIDVAGTTALAPVDTATCESTAVSSASLCAFWQDPDFDPEEPAFYYARILEQPTCRWSARVCLDTGLDPFDPPACRDALEGLPEPDAEVLGACCEMAPGPNVDPNPQVGPGGERLPPPIPITIQERAWTSPIWYRAENGG